MTQDEAIREHVELELTFPMRPYTPAEERRAAETWARMLALSAYIFNDGPEPASGWKASDPAPTGKERARHILFWAEMERLEALDPGDGDEDEAGAKA